MAILPATTRRGESDVLDGGKNPVTSKAVAFVASDHEQAQKAAQRLRNRYAHVAPEEADVIIALGGDGFMLETLHRFMGQGTPIFGMNRGSVGFLMNAYYENGLMKRLERAQPITLYPLRMRATDLAGKVRDALAVNEVSLLRETRFAAKLRILIDGVVRMPEMIADGVLVATPAGSTAYNVSVYGPILPLRAQLLALTPISVFRPRHWRGAILPQGVKVTVEVIHPEVRRVSAVADFTAVRRVSKVDISEDRATELNLLFDPEHDLEERIIKEQFFV